MPNQLLVVRAHPLDSEHSRSMRLADAFVEAYRATHPDHQITELRLYDVAIPEIDLDLLSAWDKLAGGTPFIHLHEFEQVKTTLFDHYTDQFLAAERIVVANPLWNMQVPTRLKAWADTVSRAGRTFRYSPTGEPIGLTEGKRAVHLQSAGGVFRGKDPASEYIATLFHFLGIEDVLHVNLEGVDHDPARAEEFTERALARAREIAATF